MEMKETNTFHGALPWAYIYPTVVLACPRRIHNSHLVEQKESEAKADAEDISSRVVHVKHLGKNIDSCEATSILRDRATRGGRVWFAFVGRCAGIEWSEGCGDLAHVTHPRQTVLSIRPSMSFFGHSSP